MAVANRNYNEGFNAYYEHSDQRRNPYELNSPAHHEWDQGFLDAAWDDKQSEEMLWE